MDILSYGMIIGVTIFFVAVANRERRGFFAIIGMITSIFGAWRLFVDKTLSVAYFLNSSNVTQSQDIDLNVPLFILLMMTMFAALSVLRLRHKMK